jgi:hypothetical protein
VLSLSGEVSTGVVGCPTSVIVGREATAYGERWMLVMEKSAEA